MASVKNIFLSILVFLLVVAGGTYYLQDSLVLYKQHNSYTHWAVVLLALPAIAGLLLRIIGSWYPVSSVILGTFASTALLYPAYRTFWAVPPTSIDAGIYTLIVLGIGYIATQPLKTTFMLAFRLGRFSIPRISSGTKQKRSRQGQSDNYTRMSKSQRLLATGHGNTIALLELSIGIISLILSIWSIFFLGKA